jgi:hypothetical protein
MSEDLIIGDSEQTPEEMQEYIISESEYLEYIQAAYFAISSVEDIDLDMEAAYNKQSANRIKRIKRKSIRIIDFCLNELYNDLFDEEENG